MQMCYSIGSIAIIMHIGGRLMNSTSANNRTPSIILVSSFAMFVLSLLLMEWDALAAANYGIHEIVSVIFGMSLYALPIAGIAWFSGWFIGWRKHRRSEAQSTVMSSILNILFLLLSVIAIVLPVFGLTTMKTSGTPREIEKYSYADQYYVQLADRSIRISKDKYDEIGDEIGQEYAYYYEFSTNDLFLGSNTVFFVEINKVKA